MRGDRERLFTPGPHSEQVAASPVNVTVVGIAGHPEQAGIIPRIPANRTARGRERFLSALVRGPDILYLPCHDGTG